MVLENAYTDEAIPKKKKTKRMSVSVQVDNIKETICHIMLSIKTQTKYIHFYCLCIAYSLSNQ